MASATLTRRAHHLHFLREHPNNQQYSTDDEEERKESLSPLSAPCTTDPKNVQIFSYDQADVVGMKHSNNRFKHLCSRLKRRLTLTKEHRTQSEDTSDNLTDRRLLRFGNYKTFSSTTNQSVDEILWPDFEQLYESIPPCLINALPGLNDFSLDSQHRNARERIHLQTDLDEQSSDEQNEQFLQCKRGKDFRRNAICLKLDKNQYYGQLDVFIQQLMVEKLMRTWT